MSVSANQKCGTIETVRSNRSPIPERAPQSPDQRDVPRLLVEQSHLRGPASAFGPPCAMAPRPHCAVLSVAAPLFR